MGNAKMRKNARKVRNFPVHEPNPELEMETPVFFHMPGKKPYGIFCQWFPSPLAIALDSLDYVTYIDSKDGRLHTVFKGADTITFGCCEQYMMCCKALHFSDFEIASRIMQTSSPKEQKELGSRVLGFDNDEWMKIATRVVEDGNYAKFTQESELREVLLGTGDRMLVEAAASDDTWGIGFNETNARRMWNEGKNEDWGKNCLGKALMAVRERIRREVNAGWIAGMSGIPNSAIENIVDFNSRVLP